MNIFQADHCGIVADLQNIAVRKPAGTGFGSLPKEANNDFRR